MAKREPATYFIIKHDGSVLTSSDKKGALVVVRNDAQAVKAIIKGHQMKMQKVEEVSFVKAPTERSQNG